MKNSSQRVTMAVTAPQISKFSFGYKALIFSCLLIIPFSGSFAQGDFQITSRRVVFEGSKKIEKINLANTGNDTAAYEISVINYRMNEDGSLTEITEPDADQRFAGSNIRIYPRSVTLGPDDAQVIEIELKNPKELTSGEYRSHIYFRAVPNERPLGETASGKDGGGMAVQLVPVYGITIPVIIRNGNCKSDVTLSDLTFQIVNHTPTLSVTFNRSGNMSSYGSLKVEYISKSGKKQRVKLIKGIAIYTPNPLLRSKVELDAERDIDYHQGKLHVTYSVRQKDKSVINVESEIALK